VLLLPLLLLLLWLLLGLPLLPLACTTNKEDQSALRQKTCSFTFARVAGVPLNRTSFRELLSQVL